MVLPRNEWLEGVLPNQCGGGAARQWVTNARYRIHNCAQADNGPCSESAVALVSEPTTDILLVLLVFGAKYRVQPVFLDGNNNSVQVGNHQR